MILDRAFLLLRALRVLRVCILCTAAGLPVPAQESNPEPEWLQSGSRAPYVHRLTLYDHDGVAIDPEDENPAPYSPRRTCGKCHPYDRIRKGWHFDPWSGNPGRPGEPWIWTDPTTGNPVPISARGWPGTRTPAEVGLDDWAMTKAFGRHFPGGSFGEPSPERIQASKYATRWAISGPLEIDCMFCHSADGRHDPAEAARQIEQENFKWAATAALGVAVIRGSAKSVPDDWDPYSPTAMDRPEQAPPRTVYDPARFDADGRVFFPITRRPSEDRCLFCHTARPLSHIPRWATAEDVHLQSGMTCTDCHRNGIAHDIIRGDEIAERPSDPVESFSCRGCHYAVSAAPRPPHAGLPSLHLEKIACTTCHSGDQSLDLSNVQTSFAHGLGLARKGRSAEDPPALRQPILARSADGKIRPYRGFGREMEKPTPAGDRYLWPLAHEVRPAAQSLGAGGCTECHGLSSRFQEPSVWPDPTLARGWAGLIWVRDLPGRLRSELFLGVLLFALLCSWKMAMVIHRSRREKLVHWVFFGGTLVLAVTGLLGWARPDRISGWTLLIHVVAAPIFVVGIAALAILGARSKSPAFWTTLALGALTLGSILVAMLPVVGTGTQEELYGIHRWSAVVLVVCAGFYGFSLWRVKKGSAARE